MSDKVKSETSAEEAGTNESDVVASTDSTDSSPRVVEEMAGTTAAESTAESSPRAEDADAASDQQQELAHIDTSPTSETTGELWLVAGPVQCVRRTSERHPPQIHSYYHHVPQQHRY